MLCHDSLEDPQWWECMEKDFLASVPIFSRCAGCVCDLIENAQTDSCPQPEPEPEPAERKRFQFSRRSSPRYLRMNAFRSSLL